MPLTIPPLMQAEHERPHGETRPIWFVEIECAKPFRTDPLTVVPGVLLRITNWHETVAWPVGHPDAWEWQPFNFSFSPIEQDQEGNLPQIDLTVDNTARMLMRFLHEGDGLEGNKVRLYLANENGLEIAHPDHEFVGWDLDIAGASANDEAVTFRLEKVNFFQRLAPQDRYVASRCRWEFGGRECGYVLNAIAGYQTCPKTVGACAERGLDHAFRGLPVIHPRRFGGFPGIPTQR